MPRRIKVVRLRDTGLCVEMFYVDRDIFEIKVSDRVAVFRTDIVYADSFRHSRMQFTKWIHANYPLRSQNEKP